MAIKKLLKSVDCRELRALARLKDRNIIDIFGFSEMETDLYIVMELCLLGSLKDFLDEDKGKPLPLHILLDWCLQVALPIQCLQKYGLAHKDIKTDNYIITIGPTGSRILKLIDFGIAKPVDTTTTASGSGTWRWMAPELHNENKQSPLTDIFALALVLWSLVTREIPYLECKTDGAIMKAVMDGKRPVLPAYCPIGLANLITKCWSHSRRKRPPIGRIILTIRTIIAAITKHVNISFINR